MRTNLNSSLAEQDHHLIDKLCVEPAERMFAKTKEKHISKLGTLLAKVIRQVLRPESILDLKVLRNGLRTCLAKLSHQHKKVS